MSRAEITAYCMISAVVLAISGGLLLDFGFSATAFACSCCAGVLGGVALYINDGMDA